MPESMTAFCGLTCTECPAYLATQAGDEAKAKETAALWSQQYGADIGVDDVWCDGCLVEGRKCAHCGECTIRACGRERGVESCAHCDDYACETLTPLLGMVPAAKATLDGIRAARS